MSIEIENKISELDELSVNLLHQIENISSFLIKLNGLKNDLHSFNNSLESIGDRLEFVENLLIMYKQDYNIIEK